MARRLVSLVLNHARMLRPRRTAQGVIQTSTLTVRILLIRTVVTRSLQTEQLLVSLVTIRVH